jgi:hypothetical protein
MSASGGPSLRPRVALALGVCAAATAVGVYAYRSQQRATQTRRSSAPAADGALPAQLSPAKLASCAAALAADVAARAAAFSAAVDAAVPGQEMFTADPALQEQFAAGVVAALDAALGDGAIDANSLVDRGPYDGNDRGGRVPFYLQPQYLVHMSLHDCAGLRHVLRKYGADPNVRYDMYDFPNIYSITPLHAVVKYAAIIGDLWDFNVDAPGMARVLLEAGAEPDARCEILATCFAPKPAVPYTGPPHGVTAAMALASPNFSRTGPLSLGVMELLFKHGARVDAKDGVGKTVLERDGLTPEAKELLEKLAA